MSQAVEGHLRGVGSGDLPLSALESGSFRCLSAFPCTHAISAFSSLNPLPFLSFPFLFFLPLAASAFFFHLPTFFYPNALASIRPNSQPLRDPGLYSLVISSIWPRSRPLSRRQLNYTTPHVYQTKTMTVGYAILSHISDTRYPPRLSTPLPVMTLCWT